MKYMAIIKAATVMFFSGLFFYSVFIFNCYNRGGARDMFALNLVQGIENNGCDSFLVVYVTSPDVSKKTLGIPNFITGRDTFETCKYTRSDKSILFDFGKTKAETKLTMKIKKDSLNKYYITANEHFIDGFFKEIQSKPIRLSTRVDTLILNIDTTGLFKEQPIMGTVKYKSIIDGKISSEQYRAFYHIWDCFVCYPR